MATKETATQRRTRIGLLLGDYDARNRELRKLTKEVDTLKVQVKEIEPGTYGDWVVSRGAPREIVDQQAVKAGYAARGEALPTKTTDAPVTVTPKTR